MVYGNEPLRNRGERVDFKAQAEQIKQDFIDCRKVLAAIGDETRQSIIAVLM